MNFVMHPWYLLVLTLSALINHEHEKGLAYLMTENQILREKLGKGRILLNDNQRRRLAVKGKYLGRKALFELATIVAPDTILRWHRQLVALKWDYSNRRKSVGRPRIREEIVHLIVRMAKENEGWGYTHIQGALKNLAYYISDTTVGNVLKEHGTESAPDRQKKTTWSKFLKAHWEVMGAVDFTTVEVWTCGGLVTYYILVVMRLPTRQVEIAGVTPNPDAAWMQQMGRNLFDCYEGFLLDTKYLLLDRDQKYLPFRGFLESTDTEAVLLPPKSPNLNVQIERYMRSMKSECLSKFIFFGEASLRRALTEFSAHFHGERNHQGLGNNIIDPGEEAGQAHGDVQCRERLGGMLSYYYRDAA